jgi:hypothetical protein
MTLQSKHDDRRAPPSDDRLHDQRFDVFLSYNSADLGQIERIAHRLAERGVTVWFDKWCLSPGRDVTSYPPCRACSSASIRRRR